MGFYLDTRDEDTSQDADVKGILGLNIVLLIFLPKFPDLLLLLYISDSFLSAHILTVSCKADFYDEPCSSRISAVAFPRQLRIIHGR